MIEAAKQAGHHLSMTQSEWVAKILLALVVLALIAMGWRFVKRALGGGNASRTTGTRRSWR